MRNRIKEKSLYFITFAISLIIRMIQVSGECQMRLYQDDIGMLACPAYLAGYDWSSAVKYTRYYGVAYYIIFTPVLKFVEDPRTIWFLIVYTNIVLQALTCVLSYHIAVRYLKYKNGMILSLLAVICSLIVIPTANAMTQEPALYFIMWLIVIVLLKLNERTECRVREYIYSILLVLLCAYAYLVHSRAIVFVLAIFLIFLVLVHYDKSKMKCFIVFVISLLIIMLIARKLQQDVIDFLWNPGETKLVNVNIGVNSRAIKTVLTPVGIRVLFDMFISNLFTAAGTTFGINVLAIVLGCIIVLNTKFKRCNISIEPNKKIIFLFSLICYLIGLLGTCVVWGKNVVPVYFTEHVSNAYKGFIYARYSITFFGPAAMIAFGECFWNGNLRIKIKNLILITELFIIYYFNFYVIKNIEGSKYVNNSVGKYINVAVDGFDIVNFKITILVILVFLFMIFSMLKGNIQKYLVLFFCISCILMRSTNKEYGLIMKPQLHDLGNSGYDLVQYLEKAYTLPNSFYCPIDYCAHRYQFHLKEYPIIVEYPAGNEYEIMFFKSGKRNENIPSNFKAIQLDDNEWIWTNDDNLYKIIEDYIDQEK